MQILLNEIYPNPETGSEWVELRLISTTGENPNLSNWSIFDSYHQIYKFDSEQFVNQLLVVEVSGLNNDQDSAVLKDANGNALDSFSYTSTQKGYSFARLADSSEFVLSLPSRNQANPSPTPTPTLTPTPTTSPTPTATLTPTQTASPTRTSATANDTNNSSKIPSQSQSPLVNQNSSNYQNSSSNYPAYDLDQLTLTSTSSTWPARNNRLVILGKAQRQAEIQNAIIGSLLVILSAIFLIYVRIKQKHR